MSDNRGYDYHHATSGHQFLAILIALVLIAMGGLALALFGFGLLT
ncbi:hypothetical protein QIQ16_gp3 [ssRNA phage Gerhypos.4_26]|uniref:Uncharacterized protein n=2 Tax=Leviviricetes TaxID=2842243 RepID=A0A8S5L2P6_9VIRU|nr:hypothetical protein QIQ16_gp3 [ssRNA phage Gerhypos.4_26]QDH89462.1 MAG: hypothetical protein H4Bulk46544_000002 [Leviviridae sp.]DAD51671.1 TPA_asm: hypothetical protein [ssRNA phage Gerhypos.4_26]